MLRMPPAQVWFAVHRFDTHQAHQACYPFAANLMTIATQNDRDLPCAVKRSIQMQLVDHAQRVVTPVNGFRRFDVVRFSYFVIVDELVCCIDDRE